MSYFFSERMSTKMVIFPIVCLLLYQQVDGSLLDYLKDFTVLQREHLYLEKVDTSTILSGTTFYFRIDIDGQVFHCSIQPHVDLFHPDLIKKHIEMLKIDPSNSVDISKFMEGSLLDDPNSHVLIHIHDNIATGSITTSNGERYFIEPSARHIHEPHDFQMIAYRESDIKFNITGNENGNFCGHKSHKENVVFTGNNHFVERDSKNHHNMNDGFLYNRRRRATAAAKKRCSLALVADYLFYSNICSKDETNAISYMISVAQQIDSMFKRQSLDPNGDDAYKDYGFQIKHVEVISQPLTAMADKDSYKYYTEGHIPEVSSLLDNFAYGDWGDYCLAHLFTNYDFSEGVLGLAFIAGSSTVSVGGVCTKSYTDGTGQKKYTNVGVSTTVNYGRTLLTSEVVFVTGVFRFHLFQS